MPKGDLPCHL